MKKEEKNQHIEVLKEKLIANNYIYIADTSKLNAGKTSELRRLCFKRNVKLEVVKNTLLRKAMEQTGKDFSPLYEVLIGHTSLMFAETGSLPARLIKEFRKKSERPMIKGAFIEGMTFIGDSSIEQLVSIKSKNELIADIIGLLQSPARNVISALQSSGGKLSGIIKTLSEKES